MSYVRRCSAVRVYIYTHTVCVPGPTPSPAGTDSAALNSEKFSHGVAHGATPMLALSSPHHWAQPHPTPHLADCP